jgi:hypothetical protein
MSEEHQKNFPLNTAYTFGAEKGLGREIDDIKEMEIEWGQAM